MNAFESSYAKIDGFGGDLYQIKSWLSRVKKPTHAHLTHEWGLNLKLTPFWTNFKVSFVLNSQISFITKKESFEFTQFNEVTYKAKAKVAALHLVLLILPTATIVCPKKKSTQSLMSLEG